MTTFASSASSLGVGRTQRPARWAIVAAHLAPVVALPSGLWRLALASGSSMGLVLDGRPADVQGWEVLTIVGLSVAAESTALLTIGLVRPWGDRVPAWIPRIGGRPLPFGPVAAVALLGSLALMCVWVGAALAYGHSELREGFVSSSWEALFIACYAPLLFWGPLVAVVTLDYWRRHR